MKMDRNINPNGQGRYALLELRKLQPFKDELKSKGEHLKLMQVEAGLRLLKEAGVLNMGEVGSKEEFMTFKLKDYFSPAALDGYGAAITLHDPEFAEEILEMSRRAGRNHPHCKTPD